MELAKLKNLVKDGRFFGVKFRKRTDGTFRTMSCRVGVKPTGGGQAPYDFDEKNLLCVWSTHDKGYRTIPVEGIIELRVHGQKMA